MFCQERLGLEEPLGSIDRDKLNVHGGSLGAGHPFGATGGRIVGQPGEDARREAAPGRGLISICAAGGLGVTAIMEAVDDRPLLSSWSTRRSGSSSPSRSGCPSRPSSSATSAGQPVIDGPVLLGGAPGGRLAGAGRPRAGRPSAPRSTPRCRTSFAPRRPPPASTPSCSRQRRRRPSSVQGAGVRRHRDRLERRAARGVGVLSPDDPPRARLRARDRARHPARGGGRRAGGHRPAGARGAQPLDRQGGPARGHRAARVRRRRAPRTRSSRRCASCSRRSRRTCPGRWSGSARPWPPPRS